MPFAVRLALSIIFLFISAKIYGWTPDSVRGVYVSAFERDFNFGPAFKHRIPVISLRGKIGDKISFRPNNNYVAGIRFHVFGLQIQLSKSLEQGTSSLSRYGETNASELSANYMSHKWFGDLNFFRYQGLWYKHDDEDYRGKPFPSRRDLVMSNRSISATHLFNSKKFSMRAPYAFNEHQVKSGGSWLIRINALEFSISGDDQIIENNQVSGFKDLQDVKFVGFTGFGISPGYSYNFIYHDFFVNGIFTAGPSHFWIRYKQNDGSVHLENQFNFATQLGAAIGYNGERYFGGLTWRSSGFKLRREETKISGNQNVFMVTAGFRLHEDGFFNKRIKNIFKSTHAEKKN